jgi:hypothetical protein
MLIYSFLPQFNWKNFVVLAAIINIGFYTLSLLLSGINMPGSFLEVNYGWFMNSFAGDVEKIRVSHHFWRLETCT